METGLYYYGARYYDSRLSRWISADPALDKYLPNGNNNLQGMGGVFNSVNLDVYHYAGLNPIKFTDPDGNCMEMPPEDLDAFNQGTTKVWNSAKSFVVGAAKYLAWSFSRANLGHVSEERANELVPPPTLNNDAEKAGAFAGWLSEPAIAYYGLKASKRSGGNNIVKLNKIANKVNLTRGQRARINTIKEISHNWEARKTISGNLLDAGHVQKIKEGLSGLGKARDALYKSAGNPKLSKMQREVLSGYVNHADSLIFKGMRKIEGK